MKLSLITLASLSVQVLVSVVSTPVLKGHIDEKIHCGAESQSYFVEAVTGIQTIKSYAIEPFVQKKWEGLLALKGNIEFENVRFRYKAEQSEMSQNMSREFSVCRWIPVSFF